MPSASSTQAYHAQSSANQHYYNAHPPTSHATDSQSLRTYRLSSYSQDPHRPVMASSQSAASIASGHQARVTQQTDAILAQLYRR
ncbi:hypothetical protein GGR51DRAFT_566751 [Nemania sp. FL0031]|nr:hypothetical protein GGR51DRAFT_566751 [Nemania sp. FL0031]